MEVMKLVHNPMYHQTNSLWESHYSLASGTPEMIRRDQGLGITVHDIVQKNCFLPQFTSILPIKVPYNFSACMHFHKINICYHFLEMSRLE